MTGDYQVTAVAEYRSRPLGDPIVETVTTTASVRHGHTQTSLEAKKKRVRKGERVTFVVSTLQEMPTGFFARVGSTVLLEYRRKNSWRRVRHVSGSANARGQAYLRVPAKRRGALKVRAVTVGSAPYTGSVSGTVTVRVR